MSTPTPMSAKLDGQTARCLRILEKLCCHALDGMSNKELAAALKTSPANVSRDVDLLAALGWAEKLDNGRYAVTVKPLSIMRRYQLRVADVTARAVQFDRRIDARARQLAD